MTKCPTCTHYLTTTCRLPNPLLSSTCGDQKFKSQDPRYLIMIRKKQAPPKKHLSRVGQRTVWATPRRIVGCHHYLRWYTSHCRPSQCDIPATNKPPPDNQR
ncbi:hypothetical protein BDV27DRAFT_42348 [Aspergillus caelatus]|uniref:Uncharacterized protein n=1 Tax=Aspergillus caelatus TaxID=61420 RepID=A0A5N6ZVI6_9EURO|nr:uncharacterized protein BDV27DRAFT_42348 [Aspergillus caelatus]KAE8360280.1 hypothetical protein BDV27DRAFT_42348 [Aspergillus caelatus]